MMIAGGLLAGAAWAQKPPLLQEKEVAALANELSGETAKKNLEGITKFHRQRGSRGFHSAAEVVAERLRACLANRERDYCRQPTLWRQRLLWNRVAEKLPAENSIYFCTGQELKSSLWILSNLLLRAMPGENTGKGSTRRLSISETALRTR
jgi:hypothetical protein